MTCNFRSGKVESSLGGDHGQSGGSDGLGDWGIRGIGGSGGLGEQVKNFQ